MDNHALLVIASLLATYFLAAVIIIHVVRKDLALRAVPLSKYVFGKKGIYLTMGFISIGISEIIISIIIDNTLAKQNLFLAGLGVIIVGIIKMDEINRKSLQNRTHNFGVILQFLCFPIAVIIFSFTNSGLNRTYNIATGFVTLALFSLIFILYKKYVKKEIYWYGLLQKINILMINLWLIITPILIINQ